MFHEKKGGVEVHLISRYLKSELWGRAPYFVLFEGEVAKYVLGIFQKFSVSPGNKL